MAIFRRKPPNGEVEFGWGRPIGSNRDCEPIYGSIAAVNCSSDKCNSLHLAATDHGEFITLVAGKRPSLLMVGNNDDEVYDKKPQRYTEDNVTQR